MKQKYKILIFILAGIILIPVIFFVIFYFKGVSLILKKVDVNSLPNNYLASYFKQSECQKLHIAYIARNKADDTLVTMKYGDSSEVALCIISNCNPNCFNDVFDTTQNMLRQMPYAGYDRTNFRDLYITFKTSDLHLYNNTIRFFNCTNIDRVIHTKSIQYLRLKAGAIYFTSDTTAYEVGVGLNNLNFSDFLTVSRNGKLYIFILYSPYSNVQIKPEDLSNLVNFNLS